MGESKHTSAAGDEPAQTDMRVKFLALAADFPEARLTAFFTARRAKRSNARVTLLHVIEPPEFGHWATVAETMRAEAYENAEIIMREFAAEIESQSGEVPEQLIREGAMADEIKTLIEEDPDIAIFFLGASAGAKGPGPLVSALAQKPAYLGARPIPVTVVPGGATRDELRKLSG